MLRFLFRRSEKRSAACPYCDVIQDPPPQRKRKCRDCGKYIYVQKIDEDKIRLLTEDEARKLEQNEQDSRREELENQVRLSLRKGDLETASQANHSLAALSFYEGREYHHEAQEAHKYALLSKQKIGIKKVKILTCGDERVCGECRALEGRVLTIKTALKNMPLPGQHCKDGSDRNSYGGRCRCLYVAVL